MTDVFGTSHVFVSAPVAPHTCEIRPGRVLMAYVPCVVAVADGFGLFVGCAGGFVLEGVGFVEPGVLVLVG